MSSNVIYSAHKLEYVYLIRHKDSGRFYCGCQYGNKCHPNNFWVTYFTSSRIIKTILEVEGLDSFEVLEIIPRPLNDAIEYESALLQSVDAAHSDKWFNVCNGHKLFRNNGSPSKETREKLSKAGMGENNGFFGKTHTPEVRARMSAAKKGKAGVKHAEETKERIASSMIGKMAGEKNPMFGKIQTEETKNKLKDSWKLRPILTCTKCGKEGRGGTMYKNHFDKCKKGA